MDNCDSVMTLFSLSIVIMTENLSSLLEISSITEALDKVLSLDPFLLCFFSI